MNAIQVATLATRVLGLYLWFECIRGIGWAWVLIRSESGDRIAMICSLTLTGLLGGVFFFGGKKIARLLLRPESDSETGEAKLREVQAIAFSIVGLWFIAHALLQAFTLSFQMWAAENVWYVSGGSVVVVLLFVLVSCLLFFGGRGLTVLFRKFVSPGDKAPQLRSAEETQPSTAQAAAFSVLGVYLFMKGLQGATIAIASLARTYWTLQSGVPVMNSWHWPGGLANLFILVLGYLLFRRSRALSVFWQRIQLA